jgi:hypothetical protein
MTNGFFQRMSPNLYGAMAQLLTERLVVRNSPRVGTIFLLSMSIYTLL